MGQYPTYIPRQSLLAAKITDEAQIEQHMGGGRVILTMAAISENYWVLKLHKVTKRVIRKCFECKRFHTKPLTTKHQGILQSDRTTGTRFLLSNWYRFCKSNHVVQQE